MTSKNTYITNKLKYSQIEGTNALIGGTNSTRSTYPLIGGTYKFHEYADQHIRYMKPHIDRLRADQAENNKLIDTIIDSTMIPEKKALYEAKRSEYHIKINEAFNKEIQLVEAKLEEYNRIIAYMNTICDKIKSDIPSIDFSNVSAFYRGQELELPEVQTPTLAINLFVPGNTNGMPFYDLSVFLTGKKRPNDPKKTWMEISYDELLNQPEVLREIFNL
jgi:hypothetical protein